MEAKIPGIGDLVKNAGAGLLEGLGNTAANIISKLKADPTKVAEAEAEWKQASIAADLKMAELGVQVEEIRARELETVNQTMREEGKSEHWLQWSWRPIIGLTFCAILINNYILLPYFKNSGMEVIHVPEEVWYAILTILGVASAGRSGMSLGGLFKRK